MLILAISSDQAICAPLAAALGEDACYRIPDASGEIEKTLRDLHPQAVLVDGSGRNDEVMTTVRHLARIPDIPPVFVLCAPDRRDLGVEAIREGAFDFLLRPLHPEEMALRVRRLQELDHLRREAGALRGALDREAAHSTLVAESASMRLLMDEAGGYSLTGEPVMILGERGVGKKTLAGFIHRLGPQGRHPVAMVKARQAQAGSGLRRTPIWQQAEAAGTLVLDLADGLNAPLDEDLIGALADRQAFRILVTSETAPNGNSRLRLPESLNRHVLKVPPLRERPADVPALLAHFAQRVARRIGRSVSVSPRALALLSAYDWPGNVAELEASVERAAILSGARPLEYGDFGFLSAPDAQGQVDNGALSLRIQVETVERQVIEQALQAAKGNRKAAARLLGVSLRTLFYKLKRYSA